MTRSRMLAAVLAAALLLLVRSEVAHSQDPVPGADRPLASFFPRDTLLYIEWPDLHRNAGLMEPVVIPGDRESEVLAEDIEALRRRSITSFGEAFGMEPDDVDALWDGAQSSALGLLEAGAQQSTAMIVVRHTNAEAVAGAVAALAATDPMRFDTWTESDVDGVTLTMPGNVTEFGDLGPMELLPLLQPAYEAVLNNGFSQIHMVRAGDVLVFSNHRPALLAAISRQPAQSICALDTWRAAVTDDLRDGDAFGFVHFDTVFQRIDQELGALDRAAFDRINSLIRLDRIVSLAMTSRAHEQGLNGLLRVRVDNHPTWDRVRMDPRPLTIIDHLPASAVVAIGYAFPDPEEAADRLVELVRQATAAMDPSGMARDTFEAQLDELCGALRVDSIGEFVKPLGEEMAWVMLPPPPPPAENDESAMFGVRSSPVSAFVMRVGDAEAFDPHWRRAVESGQFGLDRLVMGEVAGHPAWVAPEANPWFDPGWVRIGDYMAFADHRSGLELLISSLKPDADEADTLSAVDGYRQFRESCPENCSKLIILNTAAALRTGSPPQDVRDLLENVWLGISTVEQASGLDLRVHGTVDDLRALLSRAAAIQARQVRETRCKENLAALGEAIRDYVLDRDEYPESVEQLIEAGRFNADEHGTSPLHAFRARINGATTEEAGELLSYATIPPAAPDAIIPDADMPWQPPVNSFLLAYTTTPVLNGGRHVLMTNYSVHWVSEAHFQHLLNLARKGMTQAELDEEWNQQAEDARNRGDGEND